MAVKPLPPTQTRSPLWGLAFQFDVLQSEFNQLHLALSDVWLLGVWLSYPFYIVSYYLGLAAGYIRDGDKWIVDTRSWLSSLYDGTQFAEILDRLSNNFTLIRIDPVRWFRHQLSVLSWEFIEIIENSYLWVDTRVRYAFPVLSSLTYDSRNWLRDLIGHTFGYALQFLEDPRGTTETWIKQLSPFLSGIISGGYDYIISQINIRSYWFADFLSYPVSFIHSKIEEIYPELNLLMQDPLYWVRENIGAIFGLSVYETYNLPDMMGIIILDKIDLQIENYRELAKEILCSIILKFI